MPNVPHNLAEDDECWLIVGGDDADGANVHPCTVKEIKGEGAKKEYTVIRHARTDEKNDLENPPYFEEIEVSGLSPYEGVFSIKSIVEGEGNGTACLSQMILISPKKVSRIWST
jgi:hypothetical protein